MDESITAKQAVWFLDRADKARRRAVALTGAENHFWEMTFRLRAEKLKVAFPGIYQKWEELASCRVYCEIKDGWCRSNECREDRRCVGADRWILQPEFAV